ncbi:nuclease [Fictibacillus phosphorivorans]|uniref:Nuclease n=1 Tax=Fictibacillus phosphorivorans TaxID=1221500 RepID=A0A165P685_9BACL|nr:thermonuclease family protein [Fictibacillus phosphorivorans]KZE69130.1 nuclease [Fictibacillus phosphorivorans]
MRIIRLILSVLAILFTLFMAIITPFALIGTLIVAAGLYLGSQKRKGNLIFSKPGWMTATGLILTFILGIALSEPVEQTASESQKSQLASVETKKAEEKEKKEEARKEADQKAEEEAAAKKKEEEAKAKVAAEEKAKAEAKAKEEAEAKAAAEKKANEQKNLAQKFGLEAVTVSRVVDGDTIELSDRRKVRLIGVNTPESTTRHEEYGKEASNYTTKELQGKKVWIQKDVSETDRYSRYLRFVWLAVPSNDRDENEIRNKMFNAKLVLNGYAEPSTYAPDVKYSDVFVKFAREARGKNVGLWAFGANGTTKGDLDPKEQKSTAVATTPTKPSSSGSNSTSTSQPKPAPAPAPKAEYYQNCTELRKVYPNGVPSTHPAYAPKHDRDKDNFACER